MKISIVVLGMGWLCVDLMHGRRAVTDLKQAVFFYQPWELEHVRAYLPGELFGELMGQLTAAEIDGRLSRYNPDEDEGEVIERFARLLAANRLPATEYVFLKLHQLGQKYVSEFQAYYPGLEVTVYAQ